MEDTINEVEYASDGNCLIGVRGSFDGVKKFILSQYCYKISWLSRFRERDLDIVWRLTKRQHRAFSIKRLAAFMIIQSCLFKHRLSQWEEGLKNYVIGVDDECDEW